MKSITRYLSIAALIVAVATMMGCEKEEIGGGLTFTTTVKMPTSGSKALTEHGVKTFAVGERIKVTCDGGSSTCTSEALTASDISADGKAAKFTFKFESAPTLSMSSTVTYEYPAAHSGLSGQDGTLATLQSTYDYAVCNTTVTEAGKLPTAQLENQYAILKLTIKNSSSEDITNTITGLAVTNGANSVSVTRSAAAGPIYVAVPEVTSGDIIFHATNGSNFYAKTVTGQTISSGHLYPINVTMGASNTINLALIHSNFTAQNDQTLTGTLGANVKISIADGATVTLDNATINGTDNSDYWWSGLNCVGDATIILADGSENTVKGFDKHRAGIYFLPNKTLTIQGSTGRLNVSSNGLAAGIGGSYGDDCGNISIEGGIITATGCDQCPGIGASSGCGTITITGGTITSTGGEDAPGIGARNCGKITITGGSVEATGGQYGAGIGCKKDGSTDGIEIGGAANVTATGGEKAAGIGSAYCVGRNGTCGNISIGGTATVIATGGSKAAGIGSGYGFDNSSKSQCGTITIANTVTSVTATKGTDATNSIGKGEGSYSTCGTVTIGGVVGAITTSPYSYPTPYGAINGLFSVSSTKKVYFSQGNLQYQASTDTWRFATNQYDFVGNATVGNVYENETKCNNASIGGSYSGWIDLFGWGTGNNPTNSSDNNNDYGILPIGA